MSDKLREAAECIESLLELVDDLMPGIANISVPDYAKVNDVPIRARKCLVALAASGTAPRTGRMDLHDVLDRRFPFFPDFADFVHTADAPPEPTEEMVEAAYAAWMEWIKAGRGTGFESVKVAIRAALAAAQPDAAH